ncbi:uncharacterized protein DDB_G0290685 isoform X2 [Echeneis naucrates]|uniref:uncharacterized protein DDB_G0290685 isoform X2 n=1 Tax=Echeneis naucrates TaxID=173247 RepID=UPI001113F5B9|nr:uncharacterized protein DDB_G0290685-like isoform X2 [Echeneis naucrates]
MPSIGFIILFLGLVVASAAQTLKTTFEVMASTPSEASSINITLTPSPTSDMNTTLTPSPTSDMNTTLTPSPTSDMNTTLTASPTSDTISSAAMPSETRQKGGTTSMHPRKTRPGILTTKRPSTNAGDKTARNKGNDNIGIIIIILLIIVGVAFLVACLVARKRGNHYSVDLASRPDEANIPLSTIEPEMPADAVAQNGLKTFESTETTKEPEEAAAKPEEQQELKAEADKSNDDPSTPAPDPSPESSEDKPKEDVGEKSPPAQQQSTEEKTDDEGVVSKDTSVESLKEPNENNSNNTDFGQERDPMLSHIFWDVALDSPV